MAKYCVKCLSVGKRVKSFSKTRLCEEHRVERLREKNLFELPLKTLWKSLYGRCYNKSWTLYRTYGEKGFTMCEEWRTDPTSFFKWAEEQGYIKGKHIKIKKGCKEYSPENCYIEGESNES